MSSHRPPALLDRALRLILRARDRDAISGDLLEIYAEQKLPELGPFRANLWYARQLFSILPRPIIPFTGGKLTNILSIAASIFIVVACSWLASMELVLRHPAFIPRAAVAVLIVVYATLSLIYTRSRVPALRGTLVIAALSVLVFGIFALLTVLRSTHFEGYLLVISIGLIVQGTLTLIDKRPRLHAA